MQSNVAHARTAVHSARQHRHGRQRHGTKSRPVVELHLIADREERRALLVAKQSLVRDMKARGIEASRWARRTLQALDQALERLGRTAIA